MALPVTAIIGKSHIEEKNPVSMAKTMWHNSFGLKDFLRNVFDGDIKIRITDSA